MSDDTYLTMGTKSIIFSLRIMQGVYTRERGLGGHLRTLPKEFSPGNNDTLLAGL